jgi:hypothetical protein
MLHGLTRTLRAIRRNKTAKQTRGGDSRSYERARTAIRNRPRLPKVQAAGASLTDRSDWRGRYLAACIAEECFGSATPKLRGNSCIASKPASVSW